MPPVLQPAHSGIEMREWSQTTGGSCHDTGPHNQMEVMEILQMLEIQYTTPQGNVRYAGMACCWCGLTKRTNPNTPQKTQKMSKELQLSRTK